VPILTEQAIEGTCLEKHSQILIAPLDSPGVGILRVTALRPGGADPIGDAICGQRVIITGEESFVYPPSDQTSVFMDADSTIPSLSFSDLAFVRAEGAGQSSRLPWGTGRKAKSLSNPGVDFIDMKFDLRKMAADAIDADPERSRGERRFFLTSNAAGHISDPF
jgi:hypothetical protein